MALSRLRTRLNVKGGGILKIREISPNASDAFLDCGWLGGTDVDDNRDPQTIKDERGFVVDVLEGGQMAMIKTTLLQSGIDEINLLRNAGSHYYDAYYEALLANGNTQQLSAAICKITPGVTLAYKPGGARVIAVTLNFLSPKAAFTRTPTDFNVVIDTPYVLLDNAVPKAIPSDTAATMATAIL